MKWFIQSVHMTITAQSFPMETELQTGCRTNCDANFLCQMIFYYIDFCSCIRIHLYKLGYTIICVCVCACVRRPGELISVAQLPLRPAAPAPHFCLQRRQPVSSFLRCCGLGPTSRGWPAVTRLPSPWRPWKKNTWPNGKVLVTVLFQLTEPSHTSYIWASVKNANALHLSYATTATRNRGRRWWSYCNMLKDMIRENLYKKCHI